MKSLQEMIDVMEASRTKEIEVATAGQNDWSVCRMTPAWNWAQCDYRMRAQEPRRLVGLESDSHPLIEAHVTLNRASLTFEGNATVARKVEFIELTPEIRKAIGL